MTVLLCNTKYMFIVNKIYMLFSASNRIIAAKDHASIQINIAEVDESTGRMTGQYKTYGICGAIRRMCQKYFNWVGHCVCLAVLDIAINMIQRKNLTDGLY
ncbi:hypothetical protein ACJMK2_041257 [Sinanodonta woodiana]|uniref:40S ribosomal protein S21 n=1 Tax=Sinanodonta woodiana TaxID=1069815 RepID=A0ABD3W4W4_SINWO